MALIFVVDDDDGYRGLLRALLEEKGHKVEEAANGATVIRQIEQMDQPPNLFILDLRMPGVGGYEVALRLREHEKTRQTPILLLSGDGEGVRDLAEREGVSYLQKLVASNEEIVDHVTRLLQRSAPKPSKPSGPAKPLVIDRGFRGVHPSQPKKAHESEQAPPSDEPSNDTPTAETMPEAALPPSAADEIIIEEQVKKPEPVSEEEAPRKKALPKHELPNERSPRSEKQRAPEDSRADQNVRLDEIALALIWLNQHLTGSALKTFDEQSLERLHKAAFISYPKSKAKWVILSEDGERRGKEAFLKHFGEPPKPVP